MSMFPKNVLRYGKDEALPERIRLRAGPLRLIHEGGDLRDIHWNGHEILRRIYVAIRDRNWGTVPPTFSNVQIDVGADSFRITYVVENRQDEIDFTWQGLITGDAQGTIEFRMDGVARSAFLRNRIGMCILHPASCAGAACQIEHVDGSREDGELPHFISPDQPVLPFAEMHSLGYQVVPGRWAEVCFEGDVFEMEDQRNWTDASFKTYSTPLSLPFPVEVQAGTRITQAATLRLTEDKPVKRSRAEPRQAEKLPVEISFNLSSPTISLPRLGLCVASHGQPLSEGEVRRLAALHLDHLRVDLPLADPAYPARLERAAVEADRLGLSLHVAVLLSPESEREMEGFVQILDNIHPPVSAWLIFPSREIYHGGSPTRQAIELARKRLEGRIPKAQFVAGTNTDYIFLARTPPPLDRVDCITFAIHPQAHAFDNASLIETLEGQAAALASARHLAGGLPVMVSPITLKPRFNPYATGPTPQPPPGVLPSQVDSRQMSLLGAGWTLGSLKVLAEGGAASLTYYETTGWRGLIETEAGSPLRDAFRSIPGAVFPLYHVLADAGEFAGGEVISSRSSDGLRAQCIAMRKAKRLRMRVANFTSEQQRLAISLPAGQAQVHVIDEKNAIESMRAPEAFRALAGDTVQVLEGSLQMDLLPYALARLDMEYE